MDIEDDIGQVPIASCSVLLWDLAGCDAVFHSDRRDVAPLNPKRIFGIPRETCTMVRGVDSQGLLQTAGTRAPRQRVAKCGLWRPVPLAPFLHAEVVTDGAPA